jgi:hypothetical protein
MAKTSATVQPGPTLRVWWDGREVARVPFDPPPAALALIAALAGEVRVTSQKNSALRNFPLDADSALSYM